MFVTLKEISEFYQLMKKIDFSLLFFWLPENKKLDFFVLAFRKLRAYFTFIFASYFFPRHFFLL